VAADLTFGSYLLKTSPTQPGAHSNIVLYVYIWALGVRPFQFRAIGQQAAPSVAN
jgi:hypothetical protein